MENAHMSALTERRKVSGIFYIPRLNGNSIGFSVVRIVKRIKTLILAWLSCHTSWSGNYGLACRGIRVWILEFWIIICVFLYFKSFEQNFHACVIFSKRFRKWKSWWEPPSWQRYMKNRPTHIWSYLQLKDLYRMMAFKITTLDENNFYSSRILTEKEEACNLWTCI